jgi:hypothetical protein
MNTLKVIEVLTVVFSCSTIFLIILNQPGTGDTFGSKLSVTQTRRGFEKQIYNLAVFSSVVLFVLVVLTQLVK